MITIKVPASTSNLGAGFDTFGLALKLYLEVDVLPLANGASSFEFEGEGAAHLAATEENLIRNAFAYAAMRTGATPPHARFRVRNEIPLARGLGSSSAAIVAGLAAFDTVSGGTISIGRLLKLGDEMEGHCDNIAACVLGGFVTACSRRDRAPAIVRRDWPEEIRVVLVIPEYSLSTAEARKVLPAAVTLADAVYNVQRAALFGAALDARRFDLLAEAMRDRLHQPYRDPLIPGLREVLAIEPDHSLLGVALSGAGSAVLALATGEYAAIGARIAECFAVHHVTTEVRVLDVEPQGLAITTADA